MRERGPGVASGAVDAGVGGLGAEEGRDCVPSRIS